MGFLSTMSNIGNVVSSVTNPLSAVAGVVSGVKSLFGSGDGSIKKQYKYQRLLNEQQQQYSQQNALLDYQRQRELTQDSAGLNKRGLIDAGLNPAFMDGSSVGAQNVNGVSSPEAGSVGMPLDDTTRQYQSMQMLYGASALVADNNLKLQDARKASAEADIAESNAKVQEAKNKLELEGMGILNEGSRLDNANKLQQYQITVGTKTYTIEKARLESENLRLDGEIKQGQIDLQEIAKSYNAEQLKQAKIATNQMVERFAHELKLIDAQTAAAIAAGQASLASAMASKEQALLAHTQNQLERAKVPYADRLAKATLDIAQRTATKELHNAVASGYSLGKAKREHDYNKQANDFENHTWVGSFMRGVRVMMDNSLGAALNSATTLK